MRVDACYAVLVSILLCLSANLSRVVCYSFNIQNVMIIGQQSVKDTYFSYSLLLQTNGAGKSSLIVAAPKNVNNTRSGGDLYQCNIDANGGSSCVQYPIGREIDSSIPNGNFLGMSLDGDSNFNGPLVACAPRTLPKNKIPYLRGYCIYMKNTAHLTEQPIRIIPFTHGLYADFRCCDSRGHAYYNQAFAMAGFDVSFYSKDSVMLGAPGKMKSNGATVLYSLDSSRISMLAMLPYRTTPVREEEESYFGYSVRTAKFQRNSSEVWIVSGAPRANNLKGKVTIFFYDVQAREKMHIVTSFQDEEMGSYFGASILPLDVNNDGLVDILVGAPMTSGHTWDEGSVYFYKALTEKSFLRRIKLSGSSKIGSRFGTTIVSLGDFDLDGFNDVAISAPFEDDGTGAVYIYKGSTEGLKNQFSQRLSPSDFNFGGKSAKGFGMGMSKGGDIDGNGHNDVAIGAYKSDQVFIIKSYSIIDHQVVLTPEINSIQNNTGSFALKLCILYTKRSDKDILPQVVFSVAFEMDYRHIGEKIEGVFTAYLGKTACKKYNIILRQMGMDLSPFQINLRLKPKTANIIAHGDTSLGIQIPYSHGCGDDDICNTDLNIELKSDREDLILGLDREFGIKVSVNNTGEPAYQCVVKLSLPDGIKLRGRDCIENDGNYTCPLKKRLTGSVNKDLVFDIQSINPDSRSITIRAEVTSLGVNNPESIEMTELEVPILFDSTPYILGLSKPNSIEVDLKTTLNADVEYLHQFSVGYIGHSPLLVDVDILIPIVEQDEDTVFQIVDIQGIADNMQVSCTSYIMEEKPILDDVLTNLNPSLNETILITCNSAERCLNISCKGDYLYDPGQLATFKIKMLVNSNLLGLKYKKQLSSTNNVIVFVPVAYQKNSNDDGRVGTSAIFRIFINLNGHVPLWVYLAALIIGVILLILITYGLFKFHFFDRNYKDKLEQKKILNSNDNLNDGVLDEVEFRPMEETVEYKEKDFGL